MKSYKQFLSSKNETWKQAIARFKSFRDADMKEYFSCKDYSYRFADNKAYNLYMLDKVQDEWVVSFNEERNVRVPVPLADLLCGDGPFRIGDTLFEVFNSVDKGLFMNLSELLNLYGYGYFLERVSSSMLKSLDGYYYFFGVSFPQSEEPDFLFFNKAGFFGKMLFSPHNEAVVLQKVLPSMFRGAIDKYDINSLINNQIDRVVVNALTVRGYIG
jgi:hypothetical protein